MSDFDPPIGYQQYRPRQRAGSEYGGTESNNTVQPKGQDALSAADLLRLGYLVGDSTDSYQDSTLSLEDRRQMLGLKPASNQRPNWLSHTGRAPEAYIRGIEYPDEQVDNFEDRRGGE